MTKHLFYCVQAPKRYEYKQWLPTTSQPSQIMGSQDHQTPGLSRRLGIRRQAAEISSNFNQMSPAYRMIQPGYTDNISPHPVYPSSVMTSLQTSPKLSPPTNGMPPVFQGSEESHGFQNYGFQSDDENIRQSLSRSGNRQIVVNLPVFSTNEYRQFGETLPPVVSYPSHEQPDSKHSPMATYTTIKPHADNVQSTQHIQHPEMPRSNNNSGFQSHSKSQQHSIPRAFRKSSSTGQLRLREQNKSGRVKLSKKDRSVQSVTSEIMNKVDFFEKKIVKNQSATPTKNTDEIQQANTAGFSEHSTPKPYQLSLLTIPHVTSGEPSLLDDLQLQTTQIEPSLSKESRVTPKELSLSEEPRVKTDEPSLSEEARVTPKEPSLSEEHRVTPKEPSLSEEARVTTDEPSLSEEARVTPEEPSSSTLPNVTPGKLFLSKGPEVSPKETLDKVPQATKVKVHILLLPLEVIHLNSGILPHDLVIFK